MKKQEKCTEEDEIDLTRILETLLRRRWFIFTFTSLVVLIAVVYIFVKTPLYEVKSNVQIGYIGKNLIADPNTMVKTLKLVYNVEDKIRPEEEIISEVSDISTNKKLPNFIVIKTIGISNAEALKKNKEVVKYMKNKYKIKIEQYDQNNINIIKDLKSQIYRVENLDAKNLERQILNLKTQNIVRIDEKIKFLKNIKISALTAKMKFNQDKLAKYNKAVNEIYQNNKDMKDTTILTLSSLQMVNYQNLILNSQNRIEDLRVEIKRINNETIPNLKMQKKNLLSDKLRQLEYELNFELPNKKLKLLEKIEQLKFDISEHNVQNSKVIGKYIVRDYPVKPRKILLITVAFFTGFIFSIFFVFLLEFVESFRRDEKSRGLDVKHVKI